MKKKTLIWSINIILFVGVVFMGISQAGKGAEVSSLETQLQELSEKNNKLSEGIFLGNSTTTVSEKSKSLGFNKPSEIVYIDSIDSWASLLGK